MMQPMARDLGPLGINCVAIAPGPFLTPMARVIPDEIKLMLTRDIPSKRMGELDEFSHFVGSIIENGYLNGVTLRLDGGIKAGLLT